MKKFELLKTSSGYEMRFLSGVKIPLPTSHGFYIADSACGDGKTTMIKEIAKVMAPSGVLIVTQTTEAADGIFHSLCDDGMKDQLCLIHSQKEAESYMVEHRNNTMRIWGYNIVIITAVRLQHYPLELFLKLGVLGNKWREYVLIDEIISFFPEHPIDLHKLLPDISFIASSKVRRKGKLYKEIQTDKKKMYQYLYSDSSDMEGALKANPQHRDHFKNKLAKYRLRDILKYAASSGSLDLPPVNVDIMGANSTVILFDGTADVLFPGDSRLLSHGLSITKYSSDIAFEQFHLPFRRRNDSDWDIDTLKVLGNGLFQEIANRTHTEKVLIVTWKDIERKIKRSSTDKLEKKEYFNFPDVLSQILDGLGANGANYGVIYRGSGLERGCNLYRDFETVYFLGEWYITGNLSQKLNDFFRSSSTMNDYKKALLIQTICRLRIRLHTGQSIKVRFSDEMDYNLMFEVQEYFKANSNPGCKIEGIMKPLPRLDRHEKNHLFDIALLAHSYPQLIDAFCLKKPLSINISKSDLFRILPKDRKSMDRYKSLIAYLQTQLITIKVI